jgi:hypothetical protein
MADASSFRHAALRNVSARVSYASGALALGVS